MNNSYEYHKPYPQEFPIRFHFDEIRTNKPLIAHWHEHIEFLYIVNGKCTLNCNGITQELSSGNVVYLGPNCIHSLISNTEKCNYYCITASIQFFRNFGFHLKTNKFSYVSPNGELTVHYNRIIDLLNSKPPFYKEEVKSILLQIVSLCNRKYELNSDHIIAIDSSSNMIVDAIEYIDNYFASDITIDLLSNTIGISKFYLCRKFKSITDKTITEYINYVRCENARRLIKSGQYNVSESALLSGFSNLSYFTKTYKKHMGINPSDEKIKKESR